MFALSDIPPPMTNIISGSLTVDEQLRNYRSTMATAFITPLDIERIGYLMPFRNLSAVSSFLYGHAGIMSLLYDVPGVVARYFPDAHVHLSVFQDPEEGMPDVLSVHIRTALPSKEAVAERAKLISEWYIPQLEITGSSCMLFRIERLK